LIQHHSGCSSPSSSVLLCEDLNEKERNMKKEKALPSFVNYFNKRKPVYGLIPVSEGMNYSLHAFSSAFTDSGRREVEPPSV
jgi:hypothetical protein